jgi:peptidoglycan L-alanyl-D-glutamate endopeptidase CwlK
MILSEKSKNLLKGIHPDLRKVIEKAAQSTDIEFTVLEGLRTLDRQKELLKQGATTTLNSRHLTGHAVDIAPVVAGKVSWDWPLYYKLEKVVKKAAKDVGVTVEWGGDWKKFKDGPHWQLPFNKYPKTQKIPAVAEVAPKHAPETDTQAHTKALAVGASGTATATQVGSEPLLKAVEVVSTQQGELTSGEWLRIGVALFILGVTVWYAWKKVK